MPMRFSCVGFRGTGLWCVAVTAAAALLAGCSEDPGLQERVNRLQAEMQEKDRQLQDAQSALEKTKSELKSARATSVTATTSKPAADTVTPVSTPTFLARDQVEEGYASASKAMQKRLADELKNYTVENCAEFPVLMPSDDFPYHSKVVLTFRSDGGRSYRLEFPVSADAKGKWNFPNSSDIAGALADSRTQDTSSVAASTPAATPMSTAAPTSSPRVAMNNPSPTPGGRSGNQRDSSVVPGQTANETHYIDWGDGRGSGNNNPRRAEGSPTPARVNNLPATVNTPAPNATPAPVMQADKDVRIHW